MKKILLTALALLMGTFMYAQRDAAKVPGATPSKDVKTEAVLSAVKAPANVNSARTTKGDSELTYCNGAFDGSIGVGGGTYIEWAAAFRPSMYTADDNFVTSVDFFAYRAATYTLKIYDGDPTAAVPADLLYTHDYEVAEVNAWVNLPIYSAVVEIDHTKALWVAVGATDPDYPAAYSNEVLTSTDCCMMYFQGEWLPITDLGSFQIQPWMIAANTTSDEPVVTCDVISTFPYFNDFEDFTTNHDCWISIDNDGDGQDWITGTTQSGAFNGYNSSTGLVSKSYDYNGSSVSYDADNYLLSPEFELPAGYMVTLSWYAMSTYAPSYPDHYEVMIAPNGSTDINDFVSVLSEDGPADWTQRTVDISAYAGTTVRVVFHHQDYDQYWIVIDNLGIEAAFDCSGYGYPFAESFENGLDCWGNYDEDGDGYTWQLAAGNTGNGAKSVSWSSATSSLNPDNWLVSPEITIPSGLDEVTLAWKVKGGSGSYREHYGVYVSTTGDQPADFTTQVYEGQSPANTNWTDVTVDMTAYAGQTVRIAFRHYNSSDKWDFTIDDISIKSPLPCNDITEFPYFNDFENFLDEKHCWIDIDNDGDGYGWFTDTQAYGTAGFGVDGSNCLVSQSYDNNVGARNADNYLLSPEVVFPANSTITLSWFEQSQDGSYPDSYEVMIAPNGSTEISDFVSIYSGVAANPWTELTADISAYAGTTVRVVFHHQSSDCYILEIDNMGITVEGGDDPEPGNYPYLETFDVNGMDDWSNLDEDGDGHIWELAAGHEGMGAKSVSWESSYGKGSDAARRDNAAQKENGRASYNPDNWLVSPEITIPSTAGQDGTVQLSWYAKGGSSSYPEHYGVYVSTTGNQPADFTTQLYEGTSPASWTQLTVDLNAYIGQTIRVAFRHYDSYDKWNFVIDDVEVYEYVEPEPVECDPITTFPYLNEFEDFLANHDCWIDIDNDGDGQTWLTGTTNYGTIGWGVDESNCLVSQSYDNNSGSFDADNYLVSPEFELPANSTVTLSWYEQSQDASYPDSYEVMIAPNGSTDINDFVSIYSAVAVNPWAERTFDLSSYAGTTVRVVFHHQSYDCYMLEIDNMSITLGGSPEPDECAITEFPYFNDFEDFTTNHDCWVSIDADGDGEDWITGTQVYWEEGVGVDGSHCIASESYNDAASASYDADNYLLSPKFELPADKTVTLSWKAMGMWGWGDNYSVLIAPNGSTNISDFESVYNEAGQYAWTERTVDLTEYAGTTVRVVFRHNDYDKYAILIDDMSITLGGDDPEPDECAITTFPYFNDFENFTADHDCWISIDNDGDGQDWITGTIQSGMFNGYNYSSGLVSKSYNYDEEAGVSTDIDADNYLVSPEFVLPANGTVTLSWYAKSTGGENWPDYYEVMIAPNGSTEISDFVQILGEDAPIDWEERTADISAYAGTTVRVVFHHQDYAQFWVVLDNFGVTVEGGPEPGGNYPYLETFDVNGMDDWSNLDEDGDGHIWQLAAGYTGQGAKSVSWESSYGKASYDPDNWLISPEVTIPATAGQENPVQLSWYVQSGANSYPEHYGVYVSTTGDQPADFTTQLYEGTSPSTNWTQLSVDLNAYIGQTIRVAFRHYDSYDKWHFTIDNIEIKEYEEPEPVECDPITTFPYLNEFEDFLTNHDCWIDIDNDGDGQTWLTGTTNYGTMGWGVNASNCLVSQSYDNNVGAYNADNYLVSPEFELPTTVEEALILSWFEQSQDASYPDSYEVMIAPNGSTEISDFVSIYSGVAANPWTERTFDISSYAGQTIRVVFHHQSSDCYMLEIDNMSIYDGQGPEPVECDPITDFPYFNDFENFPAEKDCWISIDNDGDGHDWLTGTTHLWGNGLGVDESNCLVSESYLYDTGIALDADNYLLSPEFVLPAGENIKLSWFAQAQDPDYPDSYEVMIAPNGSTNVSDFVSVYGEVSTNPWAERYVDISAYAGTTVRVVFHHQDYDNFFVEIDNMGIEVYTGVNEDNDTEFAVYPNPVKNTMTLTGVEVGTEVRIYDLSGSMVMNFVYEGQIVNVENLANGVYVLRANDSMIKIVK